MNRTVVKYRFSPMIRCFFLTHKIFISLIASLYLITDDDDDDDDSYIYPILQSNIVFFKSIMFLFMSIQIDIQSLLISLFLFKLASL